jgi:hypothetical protein
MKKLFIARKWYELIPDQEHTTLVAGYGQFSARGSISTDSYAAAARTADGNLVIAYIPFARPVSVNMGRLATAVIGRWYVPTNGTYRIISGLALAKFWRSGFYAARQEQFGRRRLGARAGWDIRSGCRGRPMISARIASTLATMIGSCRRSGSTSIPLAYSTSFDYLQMSFLALYY